jgi:hypothetical protein
MVNRVLLGAFADGGYGLRVSQAGYDVTSNPVDNEKLIFNSDWPAVLPVYVTGSVSLTAGQTQTITYPALGYVPFCSALVDVGRGWEQLAMTTALQSKKEQVPGLFVPGTVDSSPVNQYAWSGDVYTNFNIRAFSDQIIIYCAAAIQVKWTVYRLRAF